MCEDGGLDRGLPITPPPASNWAASIEYTARTVVRPRSVDEVQQVVAAHPHVKALGTRHSFSDVADSPGGVLVSLDAIAPDIVIDERASTVAATAGTSYGVLADALEAQGFALENLASLPHISIGGTVATATHGSGDGNRVLSASVAAVELVTADGSLRTIDRSHADLAALAVNLGAFGVITRVHLDIQPSYRIQQHVYRAASWDLVLEAFDEVMASAYSVCLLGDIAGPTMGLLWQKHRVGGEPIAQPRSLYFGEWMDDADLAPGNSLTTIGGVPGPWSQRLAHFRLDGVPSAGGDELQSEYFVPRRHGVAAIEGVRSIGEQISPHLHGVEIRTVAADDLWMSPAYERDTVSIGFTWRKHPDEVHALIPQVEAALEPFGARPHWAKLYAMTGLTDRFPMLRDFFDLVVAYDPERKFWNPFLQRLGGG